MLIVGTTAHLEDLDRSYTYAQDVSVTALAVGPFAGGVGSLLPSSPHPVWSILDQERVIQLEEFDVAPLVRLPAETAQSLAVSSGGSLVVGTEGAHILTVTSDGVVGEVTSFDAVKGRDSWQNPAGRLPDLRSIAVSSADIWFANVHVGGVWRSRDRGESWQNLIPPSRTCTKSSPETAVVSRWPRRSASDGARTTATPGSGRPMACMPAIRGRSPSTVTPPLSPPRQVPTRPTAACTDATWEALEPCSGGLPESFPFNLDSGSSRHPAARSLSARANGRVFRSSDNGSTWALAADRMRPVRVLRFG